MLELDYYGEFRNQNQSQSKTDRSQGTSVGLTKEGNSVLDALPTRYFNALCIDPIGVVAT